MQQKVLDITVKSLYLKMVQRLDREIVKRIKIDILEMLDLDILPHQDLHMLNPFPHEYSCNAPPTLNNYINKPLHVCTKNKTITCQATSVR